jgi:putative CocE/NonD family hydrolase
MDTSEIRDGMRIDWDVPIEMDDGLVLRADVYRPIADGRYPVILSYGPYAKGLAFQEGYPSAWQRMVSEHPDVAYGSTNKYQNWEVVDPEKWVPDAYVCVRVDSRGTGRSPGTIDHFSPRETRDFYNCIEWSGVQPWASGKVGLNGISYYGINQWQVASLAPPHLAAMCIWEGAADWYRDMTHHGGILSTFWANWYDMQVKTVQYGLGERGPRSRVTGELVCGDVTLPEKDLYDKRCDFGDDIRAHPLDDAYHQARSAVWEKITVPFLSAANWGGQGLHPRGNFEGFVRAASKDKWLEAHGIEHWTHFYTDYGVKLQKRFFDHFLKGADNGWMRQPRVQLQVRHADRFVLRHEGEWPIARTQWTRYYLDPDGHRLSREPVKAVKSVTYDAQGDGATFVSAMLEQETEITAACAMLFVYRRQAMPICSGIRVTRGHARGGVSGGDRSAYAGRAGWLRASQREARPRAFRSTGPSTHTMRGCMAPPACRCRSISSCGRPPSSCQPDIGLRSPFADGTMSGAKRPARGCRISKTNCAAAGRSCMTTRATARQRFSAAGTRCIRARNSRATFFSPSFPRETKIAAPQGGIP